MSTALLGILLAGALGCGRNSKDNADASDAGPTEAASLCPPVPAEPPPMCVEHLGACTCGAECCSGICGDGQCRECDSYHASCTVDQRGKCCSGGCGAYGCTCGGIIDYCRADSDCCSGRCDFDVSRCAN